jgi:hypothetical protein
MTGLLMSRFNGIHQVVMNYHQERYKMELAVIHAFCKRGRGRYTALARMLGTDRQTVHRWVSRESVTLPAWAVRPMHDWMAVQCTGVELACCLAMVTEQAEQQRKLEVAKLC